MKEASGELNMTLITIVAIAAIAALFGLLWPKISQTIQNKWGNTCVTYDASGNCTERAGK